MARRRSVRRKLPKLGKEGFVTSTFATPDVEDYVVAELRYESPVAYTRSRFVAPAVGAGDANRFNQVLEKFDIKEIRSQFGFPAAQVRKRVQLAAALPSDPSTNILKAKGADAEFRQSGFVQIIPKRGEDSKKLAAALNREKAVWDAYVAPRPVPAVPTGSVPAPGSFEPSQGYLYSTRRSASARPRYGAWQEQREGHHHLRYRGRLESQHEDLPSGIPLLGGTMIDDLGWRNHGTAVLGEMISMPNGKGCVGISHEAKAVVHSAVINGVFNAAGAMSNATSAAQKGRCDSDRIACHRARPEITSLCSIGPISFPRSKRRWTRASRWSRPPATATRISIRPSSTTPACRKTAAPSWSAPACRRPMLSTSTAARGCRPTIDRRSALAHLVFQLRQNRQRARLGLSCDNARLWRCPRRRFGEYMVYAAFLRHFERFTDRHRRGSMPAGTGEG